MIVYSQKDRDEIYDYICNLIFHKKDNTKYVKYKEIRDYENIDIKIKDFIQNSFQKLNFEDNENNPTKELIFSNFDDNTKKIDNFLQELDNFFINQFNYKKSKDIFQKKIDENKLTDEEKKYKILIDEIKKTINDKYTHVYDKLRDKFGKKLTEDNNYHICPYCNRNYINVIVREEDKDKNIKGKVVKPDLDHFYPKSIYPFLGATISNLIPSCLTCNERVKKDVDFFKDKHIYPPQKLFDNLEFRGDIYLNKIYIQNFESNRITQEEKNSIETFLIQETYATHTEILTLINEKHKKYNEAKKNDLAKNTYGLSSEDIEKIVFYEYENINKHKEPLWKLKEDLYEQIVKNKNKS